jgi:tetratricopeptide (TPR) repeat protein
MASQNNHFVRQNNRQKLMRFTLILLVLLSSCQYYNTFFNAEQSYISAVKDLEAAEIYVNDIAGVSPLESTPNLPNNATKELRQTIKRAWKVVELYSDSADYADDAVFLIARCHYILREYDTSIDLYENFISGYPDSDFWNESWLWLSDSYLSLGDTTKAVALLEKMQRIDLPNDILIKSLSRLGNLALLSGDLSGGVRFYQQALEKNEDEDINAEINYRLARGYYNNRIYDKAFVHANLAFDSDGTLETRRLALRVLIQASIARKDVPGALKWLDEGRSDFDFVADYPWYDLQYANLFLSRGDEVGAIEQWQKVIEKYRRDEESSLAAIAAADFFVTEYVAYDSAYKYLNMVDKKFLANDLNQKNEIEDRKRRYKTIIDIHERLDKDTTLFEVLAEDSAFYGNPENFSFLIQEATIRLQEKNPAKYLPKKLTRTSSSSRSTLRDTGSNSQDATSAEIDPEFMNTDSLKSMTARLKFLMSDTLSYDSTAVDSLNNIIDTVQKSLFKNTPYKFKSIEQVRDDYHQGLFQLSEFYLGEMDNPQLAGKYYRKYLREGAGNPKNNARAYFALGYIATLENDSAEAEKYFDIVLQDYPDSPSAAKIKSFYQEKKLQKSEAELRLLEQYASAQDMIMQGNVTAGLKQLNAVKKEADGNMLAKVILYEAMVYKAQLANVDTVFARYSDLKSQFPDSPYFLAVKEEYQVLQKHFEERNKKQEAPVNEVSAEPKKEEETENNLLKSEKRFKDRNELPNKLIKRQSNNENKDKD